MENENSLVSNQNEELERHIERYKNETQEHIQEMYYFIDKLLEQINRMRQCNE